jgi:putative ABC transport system permease protein
MMELRNNNQSIIKLLALAGYKKNKSRNRLMAGAVAVTVIILCSIFSIMKGRINVEYLAEIRFHGNNATSWLSYPSMEQLKQIQSLSYIKSVAPFYQLADGSVEGNPVYAGAVVSKETYQDIFLPAYTDVYGNFPQAENEVMLPIRILQEMKIQHPKLGMELKLELAFRSDQTKTQAFVLSGYYTEYNGLSAPLGFFSEGYLNKLGFSMEQPTALLIRQNDLFTGNKVEDMLYRDIKMVDDVQKFDSGNSVNYNVVRTAVGGYDIALIGILLIAVCVYLLNYNVMNLSLNRDIRHFGLLKTLGATNRQIRKMIYRQVFIICGIGILIGILVSVILNQFLVPKLLSGYFINNYGASSNMVTLSPFFLVVSVLAAVLLSFISILGPARKVSKIAPVESMKYTGKQNLIQNKSKQIKKSKGGSDIWQMAWRNIWRSRRSAWVTMMSLFLGLTVALCSLVIVSGMDYTNNFASFADFDFQSFYFSQDKDYDYSFMPIQQADLDYIAAIDGVKKVEVVYADYIRLDPSAVVWQPYLKMLQMADKEYVEEQKKNFSATIMIADNALLNRLETYVEEKNLALDIAGLKEGTSVISISGNELSKQMLSNSQSVIGESMELMTISGEQIGKMNFGGYFDCTKDDSPFTSDPLIMKLNGPDLLISEKAAENLGLMKRPIRVEIYVEKQKEPLIKDKMLALIEHKKSQLRPSEYDSKLPYLDINSDDLAAASDEIRAIQTVMYTVSILLIILGLFNYFNSAAANLLSRRSEIAVMESIGITRRQLRRMLITEGFYFSAIVGGLIASVGSGFIVLVFRILKSRLGYVKFYFPYVGMGLVLLLLFIICISIPLVMYRHITNESIVERLRFNGE